MPNTNLPKWVQQLTNEFLHDDVEHALATRARAVADGANRRAKGRELLQRGDAILARVEKRPTMRNAMIVVGDAEMLYHQSRSRTALSIMWPPWLAAVENGPLRDALVELLFARDALGKDAEPKRFKRIDRLAEKLVHLVDAGERSAEVLASARSITARYKRAAPPRKPQESPTRELQVTESVRRQPLTEAEMAETAILTTSQEGS